MIVKSSTFSKPGRYRLGNADAVDDGTIEKARNRQISVFSSTSEFWASFICFRRFLAVGVQGKNLHLSLDGWSHPSEQLCSRTIVVHTRKV